MAPTALIVEDEPEANRLLSMLIQLRGYRTVSAFSGTEALSSIEREMPDVVFLDLMLPDVNGYEVCKSIKSQRSTAMIPVVMVTARVAVENRLKSYRLGADQYVPKPYTPDQIFEALDDACSWAGEVEKNGRDGEIALDVDAEGESLRKLGRLRNLVLASTPLGSEAADRVFQALGTLWDHAVTWGQEHHSEHIATLHHHVFPDCLVLTLRDQSGWFRDDPLGVSERWPDLIDAGGFDEVDDEEAGAVVMVVRFAGRE